MNWKFWKKVKKAKQTIEKKVHTFPCSADGKCLVVTSCTKACDKIEMDDRKVMELFMKYNACPDCGSEKFHEGPSGGAATNVKCAGCGHWFNMGLPLFIQRIHINNGVFIR